MKQIFGLVGLAISFRGRMGQFNWSWLLQSEQNNIEALSFSLNSNSFCVVSVKMNNRFKNQLYSRPKLLHLVVRGRPISAISLINKSMVHGNFHFVCTLCKANIIIDYNVTKKNYWIRLGPFSVKIPPQEKSAANQPSENSKYFWVDFSNLSQGKHTSQPNMYNVQSVWSKLSKHV